MATTKRERMDEDKLSAFVKGQLDDARDYADEIGELREATTHAYNGAKYGNEKEGRSQLVTREVRDTVQMAMPALMRTIFGAHQQVEFEPVSEEDIPHARDATRYVTHAIVKDGYMEFYNAIQDALIRKTGVFKVWWDISKKIKKTSHTDLTNEQIEILAGDEAVKEVVITDSREVELVAGLEGQEQPVTEVHDADVYRYEAPQGRLKFEAVPPEELVVSRSAKSLTDATLAGHVRNITLSDLMDLGYDEETIEDLAGTIEDLDEEEEARSVGITTDPEDNTDPSQREVMYAECWVRVDYDGDGVAELRRICVAGSGCKILENDIADEVMLADLCPTPIAHQVIGESLAEMVEDVQRNKTMIFRNIMDGLAKSIHPDVVGVMGQVNFDDLLNSETGKVIRTNAPGMVEYKTVPFAAKEAFPVLQYLDTMAESRTGLNQASQGLNADALQSTSTSAIDNATMSAQAQIELISRTFLETGVKRLYKLLLKLSVENMDRATKLRLNNRFVEVDPRSWNAEMDVVIKTALGQGSITQKLNVLNALAQKQELIIQSYGPENPICSAQEYRNTLAEIARLGGIVDVDSYFRDPANEPPQEPQEPQPDPQLILAQAEAERVKFDSEMEKRKFQLEVWKAEQEDDRKRDEAMGKLMLEAQKLQAEGAKIDMQTITQETNRQRENREFLLKLAQEGTDYETQQQQAAQQQAAAQQQPGGQQ